MKTGTDTLRGGELLAAISTEFVALLREHYGRGPTRAKTYALDDMIVVVMRDAGLTPLEQTLIAADGAELVVGMRRDFQRVMAHRFEQTIARLTGRAVVTSLAHAHVEPDLTIHTFVIGEPLSPALDREVGPAPVAPGPDAARESLAA
jgi:uncharacterized protein YbcI